jgi:hypothetical protein
MVMAGLGQRTPQRNISARIYLDSIHSIPIPSCFIAGSAVIAMMLPMLSSATHSVLADDDHNMLVQADWPRQQREFMEYLQRETQTIEQAVAYHLSLPSQGSCTLEPLSDWSGGSFNVMIPVIINNSHRVAIRCPWPHRMQSLTSPDMAGEKIRSEAATYAWVSSHCPNVPIPQLLGLGLPDGRSFTPVTRCSWFRQTYELLRQHVQRTFFDVEYWRPFVPSSSPVVLQTGYLITDFIEPHQGTMLLRRWPSNDPAHRETLFRSLSNVLLDLIKVPLPRIGSFTISNSGQVSLSGRPLTAPLALFEAEGIPSEITPTTTYASVDTYIEDLLHCHDTRMLHQPNAVESDYDTKGQLATIVLWKAIRSHFTDRTLRNGPFALQFTDLHSSNIFVDEQYNITAIVDLEWTCSLPLEMLQPPFLLSGQIQDDFVRGTDKVVMNEGAFVPVCQEFLDIFGQEQSSRESSQKPAFDAVGVVRTAFEKKSHWYFAGLKYPRVTYSFLIHHLQPLYMPSHLFSDELDHFDATFSPCYTKDLSQFVDQKVKEKAQYDEDLRGLFKK